MNPSNNESKPSLELPQAPKSAEQESQEHVEAPVAVPEVGGANSAAQGMPVAVAPDPAQFAQPAAASAVPAPVAAPPAHAVADDVDLIEKEWVERAKDIVEKTKNDPYLQNKEVNKVKAEYIGKRWNKPIKQADDTGL